MKKSICMWGLAVVLAALLFVPSDFGFGIRAMGSVDEEISNFNVEYDSYSNALSAAENAVVSSVSAFNDQRTFDIYYGDLEGITQIFEGIAGISVQNIVEILPMEGFRDGVYYDGTSTPTAVRYELVADDLVSAMNVIVRMQLPVYSIVMSFPNTISVTFMTGGEI